MRPKLSVSFRMASLVKLLWLSAVCSLGFEELDGSPCSSSCEWPSDYLPSSDDSSASKSFLENVLRVGLAGVGARL